nr:TetR/AcrR family transcriptional regulator [Kineosporia babensis]
MRQFAERGYRVTTMADIGAALGVRGPSLYKHVTSKQELLADIVFTTMRTLIAAQHRAVEAGGPAAVRLRRAVEAHVRYHATHREQAFVGNRELDSLTEPTRSQILDLRRTYEHGIRAVIEDGCASGEFPATDARLVSFAILDMGMGVATWFRAEGEHDIDSLAYSYADMALRMVGLDTRGRES